MPTGAGGQRSTTTSYSETSSRNVLWGLDIKAHTAQLTAPATWTLTGAHRRLRVDEPERQADGEVRVQSPKLPSIADKANKLHGLLNPGRSIVRVDATHIGGDEWTEF